jgi:hypothetical protein
MKRPKKPQTGATAKRAPKRRPEMSPERAKLIDRLVEELRREERERLGPTSTFEERQDSGFEIMSDVLKKKTDVDLRESVTTADEIDVDGQRYRRLKQPSSATYFSRWGTHPIEESIYRAEGMHNGPTIKPIELRLGLVEHMTPDLARIVGELSADHPSRALERTLRVVGYRGPSRAFLEDHQTRIGTEVADLAGDLEQAARATEPLPAEVASVSCGLDRMSVRMGEPLEGPPCSRAEPYERTPPPQKEHHYRKAWVGSASTYDAEGNELHTWRYSAEATADPNQLAERVAADVAWVLHAFPGVPVHCVQDAAPELRALPEALERKLPPEVTPVELVDFEHLMGYLDKVVDACEPEDPLEKKSKYRRGLLGDDQAIDRIQRNLREQAKRIPRRQTEAREAVAAALRYIRTRKNKMRYATYYQAGLPIGSGATESTCWQMQQRVALPGQSWEEPGLRGVLAVRALVLSNRWEPAWNLYAELHRAAVSTVM